MLDRRAVVVLWSAVALYLVSLALPALAVLDKPLLGGAPTPTTFVGFSCLALGWLVVPGWLGNPLFLAAALLHGLRRHRVAIVLLCLALLASLAAPFILFELKARLAFELQHVLVGYYVWLASMVVLLVGATRSALLDVSAQRQF